MTGLSVRPRFSIFPDHVVLRPIDSGPWNSDYDNELIKLILRFVQSSYNVHRKSNRRKCPIHKLSCMCSQNLLIIIGNNVYKLSWIILKLLKLFYRRNHIYTRAWVKYLSVRRSSHFLFEGG